MLVSLTLSSMWSVVALGALQAPVPPSHRSGAPAAHGTDACHILSTGDNSSSAWLCDEGACIETSQMVLCTEPSTDPSIKCVLQEGLSIDGNGKAVPLQTRTPRLFMSLLAGQCR